MVSLSVIAVVPILPALYPIIMLLGSGIVMILTLLGLSGTSEQRRMLRRFLWKQRFSLMVILGAIGLSWYGMNQAIAYWNRPLIQPVIPVSGRDWPMFRGNPQRTGVVADSAANSLHDRLWSGGYQDQFYASPTVVGNRVYCLGSRENQGRIYCWNEHSGLLQWVIQPDQMQATFSSPVVVGKRMICGEGLHTTTNARVFCFDLQRADHPQLEWSFATHGHVEGTPVVVGDRVFVAAGDDGVYALSLTEEDQQSPNVLWHRTGQEMPDVETALLADTQHVYAGLGLGGHALVMLEAATGREIARWKFEFPVYAPPALHQQQLYIGMGNGDYARHSADGKGAVVCLDLENRAVRWRYHTPATVLGAIVVSGEDVIFGCADGAIYLLTREGILKHRWNSDAPIVASLAVTNQTVCGVNTRGRLFVLDRSNLSVIVDRIIGNSGHFISSPAVSEGRIFLGTEHYGFQCYGESSRGPQ